MNVVVFSFFVIWFAQCVSGKDLLEGCESPQYLELGHKGTVYCYFPEGFLGVYWYDSEDFVNDDPILSYTSSEIRGVGYESGEFSIWPNGSLIINNVSPQNDHVYTAIKLNTIQDDPVPHAVIVVTTVKPKQRFPIINQCGNNDQICIKSLDPNFELTCTVNGTRPMLTLNWIERTLPADKNISAQSSTTYNENLLYTSQVTTNHFVDDKKFLILLVCKVSSSPSLLQHDEAMILLQNGDRNRPHFQTVVRYFELNAKSELICTDRNVLFLTWRAKTSTSIQFENIAFAIFPTDNLTRVFPGDFKLGNTGSLVIPQVQVQHEGVYDCIYGDGVHEDFQSYELGTYVFPDPVYPVIEGCEQQQSCVLEGYHEGTLTCTVERIRPQIQLEWKAVSEDVISFLNQQVTIKEHGDTFDVSLTAVYSIKSSSYRKITVECKVSGQNAELFNLTRQIDLLFLSGIFVPTDETVNLKKNGLLWILTVIVPIVLFVILGVVFFYRRGRNKRKRLDKTNIDEKELKKLVPTTEYELDKLAYFIIQLRTAYEDLYNAILPIPYFREKYFRVGDVFVDGGIEVFESGQETWERLESYQSILQKSRLNSSRIILEGDPGYGKSTLALRIAYDWCNKETGSPLDDVKLLILLRLRKLKDVSSIFQAIKDFILPRDTKLTLQDIQNILEDCLSVLIILDGYDEYPDQDSVQETDIQSIIERKMFQKIHVILTTRSSHFPQNYSSNTKRVRLIGFDELARERYSLRSVTSKPANAKGIEERLKANPILKDLCQVPLFFVMFAHLIKEKEYSKKKKRKKESFNSVTIYFKYIFKCFHRHMQNKVKDKRLKAQYEEFEENHSKLDKVAFDNLRETEQDFVWNKSKLCKEIGKDFYELYHKIGIFIEEVPKTFEDTISRKTEVRFYHTLFREWFAAHHLSHLIDTSTNIQELFDKFSPFKLPDTYRFVCGLNSNAADKIIPYLESLPEDKEFKLSGLFALERDGKVDNLLNTLREEFSERVDIRNDYKSLKQKSILQLMKVASHDKIPIGSVRLWNTFSSIDQSARNIILKSGLSLPNLQAIQEIVIIEDGKEVTEPEAEAIFEFASNCKTLKSLGFSRCLLPPLFTKGHVLHLLRTRGLFVWCYVTMSSPRSPLNLETGRWKENDDGPDILEEAYREKVANFRREWSETPWQKVQQQQQTDKD